MAEDVKEPEEWIQYVEMDKDVHTSYKQLFREGKAIVPIKKVGIPTRGMLDERGELKEVSETELYNYFRADSVTQQTFSVRADTAIAYGYNFDLPTPLDIPLNDKQKKDLHYMELWRSYVKLDTIKKYAIISGLIFGNFYAEKIYDNRGMKLSGKSWGIKRLKVLDPRTIFVDRAPDGKVINYYQHPKADQIQPRSVKRSNKSIKIPPAQMVHIKFDDVINKTYGMPRLYAMLDTIDMKLGVKADAVQIAQRRASPFLVWSVGAEDKIFPPDLIAEIKAGLEAQLLDVTENDVFVPGFIKVEAIGGDNNAGVDLIPLIEFLNKEIVVGGGVADIILAGSVASGESAKAKQEIFTRQIMALQHFIGNEFRNQVYFDLFFPPEKKTQGNNSFWKSKFEELTPDDYETIPYDKWNIIESVSDHRLRLGELSQSGLIGESEGRKQQGLRGKIPDDDQVLPNRVKLKEADAKEKQALRPPSAGNPTSTPSKSTTSSK